MFLRTLIVSLFICSISACSKKENSGPTGPDEPAVIPPVEHEDAGVDTLGNWVWLDDGGNAVGGSQVLFWNADTGYVVNNVYNPSAGLKATYDGGNTWFPKDGEFASISNFGYSRLHLVNGSDGVLYRPYIPMKSRSEPNYIRMDFTNDKFSGHNVIRNFYSAFVQSIQYLDTTRYILEDEGILNVIGPDSRRTYEFDANERPAFVHFVDAAHGWVGTETGKLYTTADKGYTWTTVLSAPSPTVLFDICFFDGQTACIITNSNSLYRTANGGKTWEKISIPAPVASTSEVYSFDRDIIAVSGSRGFMNIGKEIYGTNDAGASWRRSARVGEHSVQGLGFDKKSKVWAVTSKGLLSLQL